MRQERLLLAAKQRGLCSSMERLVLKMRWEEWELQRGVIPWFIKGQNWVFNKMFGQYLNWRYPLNCNIYERDVGICKSSEELCCVKVQLLNISKSSVLQTAAFNSLTKCIYYLFGFKKHFLPLESANKRALSYKDAQNSFDDGICLWGKVKPKYSIFVKIISPFLGCRVSLSSFYFDNFVKLVKLTQKKVVKLDAKRDGWVVLDSCLGLYLGPISW